MKFAFTQFENVVIFFSLLFLGFGVAFAINGTPLAHTNH